MSVYWQRAALPGIAVMYGKKGGEFSYIIGEVSGHVNHHGEFYAKYQFKERHAMTPLGTFGSLAKAKQAVEDAHKQTHPEQFVGVGEQK